MSDRRTITDRRTHRCPVDATGERDDRREAWASLYTLLAEGFKHPDERFHRDVREGRFAAELARLADTLCVPLPDGPGAPDAVPASRAAFDSAYVALFEGLATPYAPLIESVYRPWHDGPASGGLRSGPAAADMRARYDAIGVSTPDAYAADHLTLLLEYAATLLRAEEDAAYLTFVEQHLDWLPALSRLADDAVAEAPFHRYCVAAVCETVATVRDRERLPPPGPDAIAETCERARTHVG